MLSPVIKGRRDIVHRFSSHIQFKIKLNTTESPVSWATFQALSRPPVGGDKTGLDGAQQTLGAEGGWVASAVFKVTWRGGGWGKGGGGARDSVRGGAGARRWGHDRGRDHCWHRQGRDAVGGQGLWLPCGGRAGGRDTALRSLLQAELMGQDGQACPSSVSPPWSESGWGPVTSAELLPSGFSRPG